MKKSKYYPYSTKKELLESEKKNRRDYLSVERDNYGIRKPAITLDYYDGNSLGDRS